jgi:hypothetical protein
VDDAPYTYTDDLDLGAVNTSDELAALLRKVRIRADGPSLRTLEARTRHTHDSLSKTTVAEMLKGARLPRKAKMVAFLRACTALNCGSAPGNESPIETKDRPNPGLSGRSRTPHARLGARIRRSRLAMTIRLPLPAPPPTRPG